MRMLHVLACVTILPTLFAVKISDFKVAESAIARKQTIEEALNWRWREDHARLTYSSLRYLPDCSVELVNDADFRQHLEIRQRRFDKAISIPNSHSHTVFARYGDTLCVACFSPICTACEVTAYDMSTGEKKWHSILNGIGLVNHKQYMNLINIEINENWVRVAGNEANGRYVEILDLKTGLCLAHRTFERGRD